ncbi:MAG: signal peptidase I [Victivallaceae bacterium]|nr:signal peptidase I [Victivallaceae bacterium]
MLLYGMFKKILKFYLECWRLHRGESASEAITHFYLPRINAALLVRLITIVIVAYVLFGFILLPFFIQGASMEPTYFRRGFTFCWRGKYLFSEPARGDIVIIRFTENVSLLKRIVALPGDTIFIKNGVLHLNGKPQNEDYVKKACDWNLLPPRTIKPGNVYVIGDNRSMPIENQQFGEVSQKRIIGVPVW